MKKLFLFAFLSQQINTKITLRDYANFTIKELKQEENSELKTTKIAEKIKKTIESCYCQNSSSKDPKIKIKFKLIEFLDYILVDGSIKYKNQIKKFRFKYQLTKLFHWRHDPILVKKIAYKIYLTFQTINTK